jgi:Asp-tRNA(Asn)/Glu-tRNA(Gln) amidotransferase A subunit family amidase
VLETQPRRWLSRRGVPNARRESAGALHGIQVLLKDNIGTKDRCTPPPAPWR